MQNLLFKGYLILAYLSFFEVNPWLWIQVPSFFKRPFLVWNCYPRKKKKTLLYLWAIWKEKRKSQERNLQVIGARRTAYFLF